VFALVKRSLLFSMVFRSPEFRGSIRRELSRLTREGVIRRPVDLSDIIARIAAQECRTHALGGADGVHLASALVAVEAGVLVVTWDRRLSVGSRAAGLLVAP
jgi:hypothetical protein